MFVHSVKDMPEEQRYAILTEESIYIPGDERSRTAPGHGYPATTHNYTQIEVFESEQEWKDKLTEYVSGTYSRRKFSAFILRPVEVTTEVRVTTNG